VENKEGEGWKSTTEAKREKGKQTTKEMAKRNSHFFAIGFGTKRL